MLVSILIAVLIVGVALYAIQFLPIDRKFDRLFQFVILVAFIIYLISLIA